MLCRVLFLACTISCSPSNFIHSVSTRSLSHKRPTKKASINPHFGNHSALKYPCKRQSCALAQNDLVQRVNIMWQLENTNERYASSQFALRKESLKSIHHTCDQGHTLLHEAVLKNHLSTSENILKLIASMLKSDQAKYFINKKDKFGFTALHYAVDPVALGSNNQENSKIQLKILELLLQHSDTNIMETDEDGKTVLHWAVINNNLKAVEAILKYVEYNVAFYKDFINMKTFVHPKSDEGGCPAIYWTTSPEYLGDDLHVARQTSLKIFKLLLKELKINDTDNQGHALAHWVVVQGRNDMFEVLVNNQVNLNLQDKKGRTVLHAVIETIGYAYNSGNKILLSYLSEDNDSILNQLLRLPASIIDCNKKDKNGDTPLALASRLKLSDHIVERLEKKAQAQKTIKRRNCSKLACIDCQLPLKKYRSS